jgi:molybdenum cofactor guanylyltransferase
VAEILAVVNDDALASFPELVLVPDPDPHGGVLPALQAGLQRARGEVCLVTASDMPFVSGALFDGLLELSDGYDLAIPRLDGQSEPMHAVYRRAACEAAVAAALARGERRMIAFHAAVRVRYVDEAELRHYDPHLLAFFNVNTADDLARARSLAAQQP